jgi:hypothetical protein
MLSEPKLRAWIEPAAGCGFVATVAIDPSVSSPQLKVRAQQVAAEYFFAFDDARQWVEARAAGLKLQVRWMSP